LYLISHPPYHHVLTQTDHHPPTTPTTTTNNNNNTNANNNNKRRLLSALLALTTISTSTVQVQAQNNCRLPRRFNTYFQNALNDIDSKLTSDVLDGFDDIGLGPVSALSINDLLNVKEDIFDNLFGTAAERDVWINVTYDVDVAAYLDNRVDNIIGSIPPSLSIMCQLEETSDLAEDELPYRFAMEFDLTGSISGSDLTQLASLSPEIVVLPEDTFDPLSLTINSLFANYKVTIPLTLDVKRRKFMIGELAVKFWANLSTVVMQSIPLTDSISQMFGGSLAMIVDLSYSSVSDWMYTASYQTSLTAVTSAGTAVANLGLIAVDDDMFDDKPRE
jgi:hypothetical protein